MIQLLALVAFLTLLDLATATLPAAPPSPLRYYIFTSECYDTFFLHQDWLNAHCLQKSIVKLLGYAVVAGAMIVKVPQIVKIVKKKSTFGVSFAGVMLESFTQLSAVAYNVSRDNPFSVYGETLLIAVQCMLIHFLFILYDDRNSGNRFKYISTLLLSVLVLYAAVNPAYFPAYVIENAMVVQIFLFAGARLSQIYEVHRVKSTGSLSEITCGLTVLGNISRVATALVEVADDFLYKLSVYIALALNGYILASFLIFKGKAGKVEEKKE